MINALTTAGAAFKPMKTAAPVSQPAVPKPPASPAQPPSGHGADVSNINWDQNAGSLSLPKADLLAPETAVPQAQEAAPPTAPTTLCDLQEMEPQSSTEGVSFLSTMSQAMNAKQASEAHWTGALEAFSGLPQEDKVKAGQRAFYTQAAMLPEYAEAVAGFPPEQQATLPKLLIQAKEAGHLNVDELESKVKSWSEANPEQAYMAQMSGFASYAGEQLVAEVQSQGKSSVHELEGERGLALQGLSGHADRYVRERGEYFNGVHSLMSSGHTELAQQLLAME